MSYYSPNYMYQIFQFMGQSVPEPFNNKNLKIFTPTGLQPSYAVSGYVTNVLTFDETKLKDKKLENSNFDETVCKQLSGEFAYFRDYLITSRKEKKICSTLLN